MQIFSVIFTLWPNFWVLTRNDGMLLILWGWREGGGLRFCYNQNW